MAQQTIRAIVVDDEAHVRNLIKISLSLHGIECDCAADGSEALALLDGAQYDLAIIDLKMPKQHGHSLCTALLARDNRPLIVVVTGVTERRLADDLTARGVERIYFKPFDFRQFGNEVHHLVVERVNSRQSPTRILSDSSCAPRPADAASANARKDSTQNVASANLRSHSDVAATPDKATPVVVVLRKTREQSATLVQKLEQLGIRSIDAGNTDSLRRMFATRAVPLLVIDHEIEGFFTGEEIIRKLRAALISVPTVLVSSNASLDADESRRLGLIVHVDAAANNDEIAETVRRFLLRSPDEQKLIPEQARVIVSRYGDFPVLPQSILQLLQYLEMPAEEVPIDELRREIGMDPKASAVLLKAVNASMTGLSREITNVRDAVRVLGVRTTIERILHSAIFDGIGLLWNGIPADLQSWHTRRTLLIASAASTFTVESEANAAETTFLIGLLQDVGILYLLRNFPREYASILARWRAVGHLRLGMMETAEFGCTHAAVSAAIAERLRLPRSMILLILHHLESVQTATQHGAHPGLHRAISFGEAVADLTDAPHPIRRHFLDSMLVGRGQSKREEGLRRVASATSRAAAAAFQLSTISVPSAAELEAMVLSALSGPLRRNGDATDACMDECVDEPLAKR
jgi:HD-like signal output (HDOD) protein/DNA-binding response OmpR family regulator